MKRAILLFVMLACSGAHAVEPWRVPAVVDALTSPTGHALSDLVKACKQSYPGAVVTSGFHDPRGVSIYRRVPGLHLGYDIAMPAGAAAPCAWSGRVVAVTPWTDTEWGVTVRHDDGSEVTYGHLRPTVSPGAMVVPGQTLGTIAVDHVDVKMRDARGLPYDFGASNSTLEGSGTAWRGWLRARFVAAEARERADRLRHEIALTRRVLARGSSAADDDVRRLEAGLITPRDAERRARARATAERSQLRVRELVDELQAAETRLRAAERDLRAAEARARAAGLSWRDVERRIDQRLSKDRALREAVARAAGAPAAARPPLDRAADLERYDAMYRAGLITGKAYRRATGQAPPTAVGTSDGREE